MLYWCQKNVLKKSAMNRHWNWLLLLTISIEIITSPQLSLSKESQAGWQPWQRSASMNSSFPYEPHNESNSSMGSYLEYEDYCKQQKATSYWYRLSDSLLKIGVGNIEYGCKANEKFVNTHDNGLVYTLKTNGHPICLQVRTDRGSNLVLRENPDPRSKLIGSVRHGRKLDLDPNILNISNDLQVNTKNPGYSATRQWLYLEKGRLKGWAILSLSAGARFNFSRCSSKAR